jgi:uncharacterized protein YbaR (Trm112 family)
VTVEAAALKKAASGKFNCPECGGDLGLKKTKGGEGSLSCASGHSFPIVRGVPRFVSSEAYAESFGVEWHRFPRTQLDSYNGTKVSWTRFIQLTGIKPTDLKGQRVLEVGCGSGRFLELVAQAGADTYGADLSAAAEVSRENLKQY